MSAIRLPGHRRLVAIQAIERYVHGVPHNRQVVRLGCIEQVAHHLLLAVNRHCRSACQRSHIDPE
jgi:hypothetical protein